MSTEMWKWKSLSRVQLFLTPWTVVHGILQARILGWVAVPFSRGSSQPGDQAQVSHIAGGFFTSWTTREAHLSEWLFKKLANNQCCWVYGEKRTLRHWRWECHLVQPLWKIVWRFLKKLKIELPFDPAILLMGIYAETILTWKDIYIPMFICRCCSVTKLCPTLRYPMDGSMPGLPVPHYLPEFAQVHIHWIQPSHPLPPSSSSAFNFSQLRGLFQWIDSSHQVERVLELQFQHQSFQWVLRVDVHRLFTIVKTWKQSERPLTDERLEKMWYMCTMEYYSATKKEWTNAICSNRYEPAVYHTKWSQKEKDK